jgi:hypothetical protein
LHFLRWVFVLHVHSWWIHDCWVGFRLFRHHRPGRVSRSTTLLLLLFLGQSNRCLFLEILWNETGIRSKFV